MMVLMAKGDELWSSRWFQSAHQISSNSVFRAKMISTSTFLHSAFQAGTLTCDGLDIQEKFVLSILHHLASQKSMRNWNFVI